MSSPIPKDDFPDEMYLPPEVSALGEIIPLQEARLVKAMPGDRIRCQWVGCGKEFEATKLAMEYHIVTEHLSGDRERWREIKNLKKKKDKEIEKEEVAVEEDEEAGEIDEDEEVVETDEDEEVVETDEGEDSEENPTEEKAEKTEKSPEPFGTECLWMVNNRVPCKDIRKPGREAKPPKIYSAISFQKHIGAHLHLEGQPSPYTKECKYCDYLYIDRGSGKRHLQECIGYERRRKRAKFSHDDEDSEDSDSDETDSDSSCDLVYLGF
ncbi:hypothetical protein Agabi119p4_10737 [Agaricus bisporus var. burnettii]|uniref:Uncharacterized protein n=1 Tax=Agaricus bisporus var. burnettii TaxID=192524 RepID=A0A8H7C3F1_AGABI|nr:hypothetical protein Agabi119p4_10737 [Agaricus bisporus var. burnettii]